MAINKLAIDAYQSALNEGLKLRQDVNKSGFSQQDHEQSSTTSGQGSFAETVSKALGDVNQMQLDKNSLIEAFASGENENVHELMISLQKAGLAMSMTTAVRGKVLEAYRELSRLSF
ncbi:flagellar hook-basal body complex protein FliE [Megalodesulfovibrio paquesii]